MDIHHIPHKLLVCSLLSGKRSIGGHKCRWNDLLAGDLKKIGFGNDWRSKALSRNEWRCTIREGVLTVNGKDEDREKEQKDEKKRRREGWQLAAEAVLHCDHRGCGFVAINNAGLTNHIRQKYQQPSLSCALTVNKPSGNRVFWFISAIVHLGNE